MTELIRLGRDFTVWVAATTPTNDSSYVQVLNEVSVEWGIKNEGEKVQTKADNGVSKTIITSTEYTVKITAQTKHDDPALDSLRSAGIAPINVQIRVGNGASQKKFLSAEWVVMEEGGKAEIKGLGEITLNLENAGAVTKSIPYASLTTGA